jgi:hypothetical protein
VSRPYCVRFRSPLRRRPDDASWLTARDVNQRAEPNVRLLGHTSSAFIADKTRRLTGDVPPRHLMCPALSTDRRCAASTFIMPCPLRWQAATRPSCRRRACLFHWHAVRLCYGIHCTHHHSRAAYQHCRRYGDDGARRSSGRHRHWILLHVFPPFCPWAHMSGPITLVRVPLEL